MSEKLPEFEPPFACVNRIIKQVLPTSMFLTKDAKAAFVRAAGIFIFYLTHCSNDYAKESKRSTIYPQDVLKALSELGFDDFDTIVEEFLEEYKRVEQDSKNKILAAGDDANGSDVDEQGGVGEDDDDEQEDEEEEEKAGGEDEDDDEAQDGHGDPEEADNTSQQGGEGQEDTGDMNEDA